MITITPSAAAQIKEIIAQEKKDGLALRLFLDNRNGGGQYGLGFDDQVREGDTELESEGLKILVDSASAPYVAGSEIDFAGGLEGKGFTITNPNAQHMHGEGGCGSGGCGAGGCACGSSSESGSEAGSGAGGCGSGGCACGGH
ncbi:MAG: iron-sulfur cluster assembly accessory protein [Dehalococcoidia bacterium]|nr:iron-sulfur cluster assembly accessory protein [Dehalococcoidia bacterium]